MSHCCDNSIFKLYLETKYCKSLDVNFTTICPLYIIHIYL